MNADASFVLINKKGTNKLGESFRGEITITQNNKSILLLKQIILYLGFGILYNRDSKNATDIRFANLSSINSFISKASQCKFLGAKALDFKDFCKGIDLINQKAHLTIEGIKKLKEIKKGMNNNRTNFN
jgi:LAGLIDADG endonuclease